MPLFLYFYYTDVSGKTYEKKYYLIQEDNYDYFEDYELSDSPIVNENSIREFISYALINIFNYRTNVAIRNLDDYEQYFSSAAFNYFKFNFRNRVQDEIENGVVINEVVLENKPRYMGSYKYGNGFESKLYHIGLREVKTGETGTRLYNNFDIFVEIQFEDFSVNGKGLSIRGIEIR